MQIIEITLLKPETKVSIWISNGISGCLYFNIRKTVKKEAKAM